MAKTYDIQVTFYASNLGTPLTVTGKQDSSYNFIKSLSYEQSRQNGIGSLTVDLTPTGLDSDWLDILETNDLVEVQVDGYLEFQGLVNKVSHTSSVKGGNTFTVTCHDMGVVFDNYAKLVFSKTFQHFIYNKDATTTKFIDQISTEFRDASGFRISDLDSAGNSKMLSILWKIFFKLFKNLISTTPQNATDYTFSDNKTIFDKFGENGEKYFSISDELLYDVPLYVNPFANGDATFHSLVKEFCQEPYNEIITSNFNKKFPIQSGEKIVYLEGYKSIIRPSVFHPDYFKTPASTNVPLELIEEVLINKHNAEVFTIFASNAEMAHLGTGHTWSTGKYVIASELATQYGIKVLEIPIKSGYNPEVDQIDEQEFDESFKGGGELLYDMFKNNNKLYSGTLKTPFLSIKPGMLIEFEHNFGAKIKNIKCLIDKVSVVWNVIGGTAPTCTFQFIRGEVQS